MYFVFTWAIFLLTGSKSGMVLVLDPLVKDDGSLLIQPALSQCQRSEDSGTSQPSRCNSDTTSTSEKIPAGSAFRGRLDSGASNRSNSPFRHQQLDSGALEPNVGLEVSDLGRRNRSHSTTSNHSLSSEEKHPTQDVQEVQVSQVSVSGNTSGIDSEAEECPNNDQDQPERGAFSRKGHHVNGLLNGSGTGEIDVLKEKVDHLSVCPSLNHVNV